MVITRAKIAELESKYGVNAFTHDFNEDHSLELICYKNCTADDDKDLQNCRGVVFHGEELVMQAFPFTHEISHVDDLAVQNAFGDCFDQCTFYRAREGALIRVFNFDGRWYYSTHRSLNAFKSKWASQKSFGDQFSEALKAETERNPEWLPHDEGTILSTFEQILDPAKQYMFLVTHDAVNRVVCLTPDRPEVFHVGTFTNGELSLDTDIGVPHGEKLEFQTLDELVRYVDEIRVEHSQGVIAFAPGNRQIKVLHEDYLYLFGIRGNEPSVRFRYLQVRMDQQALRALETLYPDFLDDFDQYENYIYGIAKNLLTLYVKRFIKKQKLSVEREEYAVLKRCHAWHKQDRATNKIRLNVVIAVLNAQHPTTLNKMIRRVKLLGKEFAAEPWRVHLKGTPDSE